MNSHVTPVQLALLAGRDLPGSEHKPLLQHLESCAECRHAADSFERAGRMLRDFAVEPSEDDLEAVRESIVSRVLTSSAQSYDWRWAWLGFASAALALIAFFSVRHADAPLHVVETRMLALPPIELPRMSLNLAPSRRPQRRKPETGIRTLNLVAHNDGTSLLKITTADPNVVILLPMGEKHEN